MVMPIRTCLGCRTRSEKKAMVRFAFLDGEWSVSPSGKGMGRGGYVHPAKACVKRTVEAKQLRRAVKKEISGSVREKLEGLLLRHCSDALPSDAKSCAV